MKKQITRILAVTSMFVLGTSELIFTENVHGDGKRFSKGITGRTGANGGLTCIQCHGGNLNAGKGNVTITTDIPNFKYQLGKEYNIIVTVTDSNAVKYGIDFTAIKSADTLQKGTLIPGEGSQLVNGELTHVAPGSSSKTFNFKWKAPAAAAGIGAVNNITFYVAANAANGDGKKTGDLIYATNQVIALDPSSAGLPDVNKAVIDNLTVYPNPTVKNINVTYSISKAREVTIQLIALNGQLIANLLIAKQEAGLHVNTLELPTSIKPGMYSLIVQSDEGVAYRKLVVGNK
jgi:hypothetical protein